MIVDANFAQVFISDHITIYDYLLSLCKILAQNKKYWSTSNTKMKKNDNKNIDSIVMLRSGKTKVGKEKSYFIKKNKWNFGILMLIIELS